MMQKFVPIPSEKNKKSTNPSIVIDGLAPMYTKSNSDTTNPVLRLAKNNATYRVRDKIHNNIETIHL